MEVERVRETACADARSFFSMMMKGAAGLVSAKREYRQSLAKGGWLQQQRQELGEHQKAAAEHFDAIDKALKAQQEILKAEAATLQALDDWIPSAFESVR